MTNPKGCPNEVLPKIALVLQFINLSTELHINSTYNANDHFPLHHLFKQQDKLQIKIVIQQSLNQKAFLYKLLSVFINTL